MLFGRGPFMNAKHWRGVSNEIIFDRFAQWAQVRPDDIRVPTLPLLRGALAEWPTTECFASWDIAPSFDFQGEIS